MIEFVKEFASSIMFTLFHDYYSDYASERRKTRALEHEIAVLKEENENLYNLMARYRDFYVDNH